MQLALDILVLADKRLLQRVPTLSQNQCKDCSLFGRSTPSGGACIVTAISCPKRLSAKNCYAGESSGVRVPLAGYNGSGQQHYIILGRLLRTGRARPKGKGRRYREANPPVFMHRGSEALERIEGLEYGSDYEDDGYVLSSVDMVKEEAPTGLFHSQQSKV